MHLTMSNENQAMTLKENKEAIWEGFDGVNGRVNNVNIF